LANRNIRIYPAAATTASAENGAGTDWRMIFQISRRRALVVFGSVEIGTVRSLEKFGVGPLKLPASTGQEAAPDRLTAAPPRLDLIGCVGKTYTSRAGKRPNSAAAEMNQIIERPVSTRMSCPVVTLTAKSK
jgi:hypothetical protein